MSGVPRYRQVWLKRGDANRVAWIPEQFAAKGRPLKLKGEDGWKVEEVYPAIIIDAVYLQEHLREDYRHQREASDI